MIFCHSKTTRSETSQLCRARRCVYWKAFKVSTDEAIDFIQVGTGLSALDIELRHQRSSFVDKLSCSTNSIRTVCVEVVNWMVFLFVFFSVFSSSRVFCHCIVFCLSLSVCLFATHVVNKDLYIKAPTSSKICFIPPN